MARITEFVGEHLFLSNGYPARVRFGGHYYPTVEHAYQAAKTLDLLSREAVRASPSYLDVWRLGQRVPMRPAWDVVRVEVMRILLRKKFAHPKLGDLLGATGDAELVAPEGDFWGRPANTLGRLLMEIRGELR